MCEEITLYHMLSRPSIPSFSGCYVGFKSNTQRQNKITTKQECIPVGCVPSAAVAVGEGLHQAPPQDQAPSGSRPPQSRPPPEQTPREQTPPPGADPPWHTLMKILPCPELRLRAVKIFWMKWKIMNIRVMSVWLSKPWWISSSSVYDGLLGSSLKFNNC